MLNQWTRNVQQNRPTPFYHNSPSGISVHRISLLDTERRFGCMYFSRIGRESFNPALSSLANIYAVNRRSWPGVRKDLWTKLFVCERFITTIVKLDIAARHARQIVEKNAVSAILPSIYEYFSKLSMSKATKFLHSVQRNKSGIKPIKHHNLSL